MINVPGDIPEENDIEQIVANLAWDYCSRKQNDDKFMSLDEYITSKKELFGHPERIANFRTIVGMHLLLVATEEAKK